MSQEPPPAPAAFRRATRADAVALAQTAFLEGRRVDMGVLSGELGIGRATLYRWVGSREELLEEVLEGLAVTFMAMAREHAQGKGDERVINYIGLVVGQTMHFEPIRAFVRQEPELALRLLLAETGRVHRCLADVLREVLAETRSPDEVEALDGFVEVMVQVGTALQWATFAAGDEPRNDRVLEISRALLAAYPARGTAPPTRRR